MTVKDAIALIRSASTRMDELYGKPVFDEWAIVVRSGERTILVHYAGPRMEQFQKKYFDDTRELRQQYRQQHYNIGDFEFARQAEGTKVEAFIRIGDTIFLVCNNTSRTMDDITAEPRWLAAQEPFAELCDKFRADPVVHP